MSKTELKRLIRIKRVIDKTGRSRSSLYADVKAGLFPSPIEIGPRSVAWLESDIDQWIDEKVTESRRGLV